jgi:hypothetical protein
MEDIVMGEGRKIIKIYICRKAHLCPFDGLIWKTARSEG